MVIANTLVGAAMYVFGAWGAISWSTLGLLVVGLGATIAGGCALNNVYDRDIDKKMARTKERVMPAGRIPTERAILIGSLLAALGLWVLWHINTLTFAAGFAGVIFYVFAYTPLKHVHALSLYVGAVAGAMPAVAGYVAATNRLDYIAAALFAFLFLWQVVHFLAIARFRYDEYAAAGVPLLIDEPTDSTRRSARRHFFISLVVLLSACAVLGLLPYVA